MAAKKRKTIIKKGLGRGLSALLGEEQAVSGPAAGGPGKLVAVGRLHPGRYQPRRAMDDAGIGDLARSIREKGILQPLLVRAHPERADEFEIIAGERRWRAAQKAQLHDLPVIIRNDLTDREALEIALVENLQREDLSALDEAQGYRRLMEEFSHTQDKLAAALGKSRSHVANMMRLLDLPEEIRAMLQKGELTAGHARALLKAGDPIGLAGKIVKEGLNVRQAECLARTAKEGGGGKKSKRKKTAKDADTLVLERDLANLLGLKVDIKFTGKGGTLTFHYKSLDQLDEILSRLSHARPDG
ncbi:MAG TPA: ParB/RepB/Spo0J family partition protein [Alphaproteobacteria bacterium]|nr:ParB/RepB/Spo0J family partition protein [Alphaproteobacteria bacterium]